LSHDARLEGSGKNNAPSWDKGALDLTIGALNRLVLLTGSWAVVMGTRVALDGSKVSHWLTGAALPGVLFLLLKILGAGCYWHLVDLLWIGIFLVLYLI